jgi:Skp family chaperone for outer membrane proteins
MFQKDSSEWRFKDLELRLAVQALEGRRAIFQEELRQQRESFYVLMLEDMQQAVAIVAKERGVSMVLRTHNDLLDGSTESKARVFEARVVWYASEEVDLTPAVIKLLQVPLPKRPEEAAGTKPADAPKDQPGTSETNGSQQGRK